MTDDEREAEHQRFLEWRCVETPCKECRGIGKRLYGSTSTWRGGIGGAAITTDVCDGCWGSGDASYPGANLRALRAERLAWDNDQCMTWFARATGATLSSTKEHMFAIADILDKEQRRRKVPDGFSEFWWRSTLRMVADGLRELAGMTAEERRKKGDP